MSFSGYPPFSNEIPRRRNRRGDPVPRRYVFIRPLISYAFEALESFAKDIPKDPDEVSRGLVRLKSLNAVVAMDHANGLTSSLYQALNETNARLEEKVQMLEPAYLEKLEQSLQAKAEAASARSLLGLSGSESSAALEFGEDEPASLEEIAGEHGLPPPERESGLKLKLPAITLLGGSVLGISLGLLINKIELSNLSKEWLLMLLFCIIGCGIMAAMELTLFSLGQSIGTDLYLRSMQSAKAKLWLVWTSIVALAAFMVVSIMIDSRIERVGLFKSAAEDASLQAVKLSPHDLNWVSLMLVVPAVCCFVVLGIKEGKRKANLCKLIALRYVMRKELRADPAFRDACEKQARAYFQGELAASVSARVQEAKGQISDQLPLEDRQQIEDTEMDAIAHSWASEDAIAEYIANKVRFKRSPSASICSIFHALRIRIPWRKRRQLE